MSNLWLNWNDINIDGSLCAQKCWERSLSSCVFALRLSAHRSPLSCRLKVSALFLKLDVLRLRYFFISSFEITQSLIFWLSSETSVHTDYICSLASFYYAWWDAHVAPSYNHCIWFKVLHLQFTLLQIMWNLHIKWWGALVGCSCCPSSSYFSSPWVL